MTRSGRSMRYMLLYGGPIGDSLVAIQVGRTLAANVPGATLELLSTRENGFVRDLCKDLPFIRYRSLPKESIGAWIALLGLMVTRNALMAYEPVSSLMSPWWRLILWCARFRPGSTQLRYQTRGYERTVPRGVMVRIIDYERESLFKTPATVLRAWGISPQHLPLPTLPPQPPPERKPYLLFHFFAGQIRRSIPTAHARAILEAARAAYPRHAFVLTCAKGERERAERMAHGIADVSIESGHSPRELTALLCGAAMVVGTASGIVIMAAHLRRPLISLTCLTQKKAFLPNFSPETVILAAYDQCRCRSGNGSGCSVSTEEGDVYRCIYFITTEEVLAAMHAKLPAYA